MEKEIDCINENLQYSESSKKKNLKKTEYKELDSIKIPKCFCFLFKALVESTNVSLENKKLKSKTKEEKENKDKISISNPFINYNIVRVDRVKDFCTEMLLKLGHYVNKLKLQESTIISAFIYIDNLLEKDTSLLNYSSLEK